MTKPHPSADSPGGNEAPQHRELHERARQLAEEFAPTCVKRKRLEDDIVAVAFTYRDAEIASLRERLAGVEEQSEARRRALLAVGDERRVEWTRAEKAESERDAALAKLAEAERKGEAIRGVLRLHHKYSLGGNEYCVGCHSREGCERYCPVRAALQPVTEGE